jgi:uncharacterized protein related to proFAR isomerase
MKLNTLIIKLYIIITGRFLDMKEDTSNTLDMKEDTSNSLDMKENTLENEWNHDCFCFFQ